MMDEAKKGHVRSPVVTISLKNGIEVTYENKVRDDKQKGEKKTLQSQKSAAGNVIKLTERNELGKVKAEPKHSKDVGDCQLSIRTNTCIHCPGRVFTYGEFVKHQRQFHEARLRCTHCDFNCDKNKYTWMVEHYRCAHNIAKDFQNYFDRHPIPLSIPKGNGTLMDFTATTGLRLLPVFAIDKHGQATYSSQESAEESNVEIELQTEEVYAQDRVRLSNLLKNSDEADTSDWSPIFVSQQTLLPIQPQGLNQKGKNANSKMGSKNSTRSEANETELSEGEENYATESDKMNMIKQLMLDTEGDLTNIFEMSGQDSAKDSPKNDDSKPLVSDYNKITVTQAQDGSLLLHRYGCISCSYEAVTPQAVKNHWVKEHMPNFPYQCVHCRVATSDSNTLVSHIIQMHPGSPIVYWLQTSKEYVFKLQVETGLCAPMLSDQDYRLSSFQAVAICKPNKKSVWNMVAIGYRVLDKWYCCHLCSYRTLHLGSLVKHNKTCVLPHISADMHLFMCIFCKEVFRFNHQDLIAHQADSACTPHVKKRDQVVKDVEKATRVHSETVDKLIKFLTNCDSEKSPLALDWNSAVDICFLGYMFTFSCKWCAYHTNSLTVLLDHVTTLHHWPSSFCCTCGIAVIVSNSDREKKLMTCNSCGKKYDLVEAVQSLELKESPAGQSTYRNVCAPMRCKACNFRTSDKASAIRHSHKHTSLLMYKCGLCSFTDFRPAVMRSHIAGIHENCHTDSFSQEEVLSWGHYTQLFEEVDYRNQGMKSKVDSVTGVPKWRRWLEEVTQKPPSKEMFSKSDMPPDDEEESPEKEEIVEEADALMEEANAVHGRTIRDLTKNMEKVFTEVHYQCLSCLYRCLDRSCMRRHVKYMHLQKFAHRCPYCTYGSVEKTKVRNHVFAHHPDLSNKFVDTNKKVLGEMKEAVKDYFVKIDPSNHMLIAPKRKDSETKTGCPQSRTPGPRAKALEVILKKREKEYIGISKSGAHSSDMNPARWSDKSFTELQNITMLTVEAEKKCAWIDTPTGVLNVNFHGYVPKVEVLDSTPTLKEGEDFDAFEVKWETDSEYESDSNLDCDGERRSLLSKYSQKLSSKTAFATVQGSSGDNSNENSYLKEYLKNTDVGANPCTLESSGKDLDEKCLSQTVIKKENEDFYVSVNINDIKTEPDSETSKKPIKICGINNVFVQSNKCTNNMQKSGERNKRKYRFSELSDVIPNKCMKYNKQFLVDHGIDHPHVHKILVDNPLLTLKTYVEVADIMRHLLHLK